MRADDADVVAASVAQPERFSVVFDRYHRVVWGFLARMAGTEAADDLAGEVFVAAFAHRDRYDPTSGSVRAWLYGIAANLQRSRWRSDARRARTLERVAGHWSATESPIEAAEDVLAGRQQLERVTDAMSLLSEPHREVLVLFVWEELTYDEIASALSVEVGTVRSRLARARIDLRSLVGLNAHFPNGTSDQQEVTE